MWLVLAVLSFVGGMVIIAVGARTRDHGRAPATSLPAAKIDDGRPFRETPARSSGLATVLFGVAVMIGGPFLCLALYAIDNIQWWR